jgi:hypothetical protein
MPSDQTLRGVAQAGDLRSDLQLVEPVREIVLRHFVIGSVTAVRDWPTEPFLRRWPRQAKRDHAFQREVGSLPIVTTIQVPGIGFDGDVNYRDAEGNCCRAVSGFMVSGALAIATHSEVSMPGIFLACDRSYPQNGNTLWWNYDSCVGECRGVRDAGADYCRVRCGLCASSSLSLNTVTIEISRDVARRLRRAARLRDTTVRRLINDLVAAVLDDD